MLRPIGLAALSMAMFVAVAAGAEAKVFRGTRASYRRRDDAGYRLRFDVSVQATRIADARGERWRGTFRAKVLVTRGNFVDTCRSGRLRFTVRPV